MSAQILSLFALPVYREVLPRAAELNPALEAIITQRREEASAAAHSVRGGYQSPQDFFQTDAPPVKTLQDRILKALKTYLPAYGQAHGAPDLATKNLAFSLWGWATALTGADYNAPHIHPRSTISGVYYVKTPASILENKNNDYSGWIGLLDPRSGAQLWPIPGQVTHQHLPPEPGSLILFPSYAAHFVPPTRCDDERLCIAFNIRHQD